MKLRKTVSRSVLAILLALLFLFVTACGAEEASESSSSDTGSVNSSSSSDDEEEEDWTSLDVREATGENGVVTSASAYASKAGLEILEAGGNAFDAAVATAFAIGVVEPYASGVGGGGVMTAYSADTGEYTFYNFREFVPEAGTPEAYGTDEALDEGITSVGVPTEVAGLVQIHEDLGSGNLTLAEVMDPAITYAKEGFTIESTLASEIMDGADYFTSDVKAIFTEDGNGMDFFGEGDTFVQEDYAEVLEEIAENGKEGFYTGWVAEAIVEANKEYGGLITQEDLDYACENYPRISEPLHGTYNGYDIYSANLPSSGGVILIEALNMLEHYQEEYGKSLSDLGNNTADYVHVIGTALQLSYADKRHYIADNSISPLTGEAFNDVPLDGLMSKAYAAQRFDALYDPDLAFYATSSYDYGGATRSIINNCNTDASDESPYSYQTTATDEEETDTASLDPTESWSTTSFSVADKDGNIVSFTQTLNHFWGSYIVPDDCGFFLNNQLSSFYATSPTSVHYVQPYKQPVSHIMPTIIMKDGLPYATLGSPGSMRIPGTVAQVIMNLVDFDMDMQTAIENGRIYDYAVQTSDAGRSEYKKLLTVEAGDSYNMLSAETIAELAKKNYYIVEYEERDLYFGGVQGILFNYDSRGTLLSMTGGADPRRDGKALAY